MEKKSKSSCNCLIFIGVDLPVVEELLSLLFYCESGINQYAKKSVIMQKTLSDVLVASLLVLELSCFRKIVLPYHLRMLLCVFMRR